MGFCLVRLVEGRASASKGSSRGRVGVATGLRVRVRCEAVFDMGKMASEPERDGVPGMAFRRIWCSIAHGRRGYDMERMRGGKAV